jgi:subtilase family serine protease
VLLGTRTVGSLQQNATSTSSTTVQIPAGQATGLYYLFTKADVHNTVLESSEINNVATPVTLRVGPDLAVSSMTAPFTAAAGATIAISDTTINNGGGAAPASLTRFYLSANLSVEASDTLIGARSVPALNAGGTSAGTSSIQIPANMPAGSYWLIGVADGGQVIVETSESNNTRVLLLRVTIPPG